MSWGLNDFRELDVHCKEKNEKRKEKNAFRKTLTTHKLKWKQNLIQCLLRQVRRSRQDVELYTDNKTFDNKRCPSSEQKTLACPKTVVLATFRERNQKKYENAANKGLCSGNGCLACIVGILSEAWFTRIRREVVFIGFVVINGLKVSGVGAWFCQR